METGARTTRSVRFPSAGKYNVLGAVDVKGKLEPTGVGLKVSTHDPIPTVGQKPPPISTPTVQSVNGNIASIDTRTPHDDMHDVNFRDVVGKKPVVLLFATPLLSSIGWRNFWLANACMASACAALLAACAPAISREPGGRPRDGGGRRYAG